MKLKFEFEIHDFRRDIMMQFAGLFEVGQKKPYKCHVANYLTYDFYDLFPVVQGIQRRRQTPQIQTPTNLYSYLTTNLKRSQ